LGKEGEKRREKNNTNNYSCYATDTWKGEEKGGRVTLPFTERDGLLMKKKKSQTLLVNAR